MSSDRGKKEGTREMHCLENADPEELKQRLFELWRFTVRGGAAPKDTEQLWLKCPVDTGTVARGWTEDYGAEYFAIDAVQGSQGRKRGHWTRPHHDRICMESAS